MAAGAKDFALFYNMREESSSNGREKEELEALKKTNFVWVILLILIHKYN